jgi:hypothetical protein
MNKFIFAKIIEKFGESHEKLNINGENKKVLLLTANDAAQWKNEGKEKS